MNDDPFGYTMAVIIDGTVHVATIGPGIACGAGRDYYTGTVGTWSRITRYTNLFRFTDRLDEAELAKPRRRRTIHRTCATCADALPKPPEADAGIFQQRPPRDGTVDELNDHDATISGFLHGVRNPAGAEPVPGLLDATMSPSSGPVA